MHVMSPKKLLNRRNWMQTEVKSYVGDTSPATAIYKLSKTPDTKLGVRDASNIGVELSIFKSTLWRPPIKIRTWNQHAERD